MPRVRAGRPECGPDPGVPATSPRPAVGAHYPHDVVAGLLLGAAVAALGWLLVRLPLTRIVEALRTLPVTDHLLAHLVERARSKRGNAAGLASAYGCRYAA